MSETAPAALSAANQGEQKFLLDAATAEDIWRLASARLQPQVRDSQRPVTYHRTTYFDTADHAYYRGAGPISLRVRVREYATSRDPGAPLELLKPCYLELKQSSLGRRSKLRLEVEPREIDRHLHHVGGSGLLPCLTTWYQRAALTDATESLRITLDRELRYCSPQPIGGPCDPAPPALAAVDAYVLEIKAWGTLPVWLRRILRSVPEASGFSKFRDGMQAVGLCADRPSAVATGA